ncbi:MAG TPA: hypothetical protein VEA59_06705, partial [Patescibacteria group bacterium]|nr:hypothetical protein [Patescibacteria group bacterium]
MAASIPPLAAETITTFMGFPITNTLINSSATMIGFVIIGYIIKTSVSGSYQKTGIPGKLVNFVEAILEI